jgi:FkbM family methyltransferase
MKELIKSVLRWLGLDVRRYQIATSESAQLKALLDQHRVDLIIDVGANTGQFGQHLRRIGYRGRIVSFEPLPAAWEALRRHAHGDRLWEVAPRTAVGRTSGEITINVANNSVSSSVLPMLDAHHDAAPASRYTGTEVVPMNSLNALALPYLRADTISLVKIDTQGYEEQVLAGAGEVLARAAGVQIELSLLPLYAGQPSFRETVSRLEDMGFQLWAVWPAFTDPRSGRMLQLDALFFRER